MNFTLVRAEYDQDTERAYVELRARDDDGVDLIATAIFSVSDESQALEAGDQTRYSPQSSTLIQASVGGDLIFCVQTNSIP